MHVVGVRVLQLGDGAEVAGLELGHVRLGLALEQPAGGRDAREASRVTLRTVASDFSVPRDDAQHRDAAGERIGNRLPDEGGVARRSSAALTAIVVRRFASSAAELALGGRRDVGDDARRAAAGCRWRAVADVQSSGKSLPATRGSAQAGRSCSWRQRALREERLHQRLVGLGHHLDQLLRGAGAPARRAPRRDLGLGHWLPASAVNSQRLHAHQVDDASEIPLLAERQLDRHDLAGAVAVQRLERALEAGALAVEPVHDDEPRQAERRGLGPELLGLHFDAGHRVDDDDGRFGDAQRGAGVAHEVGEAGRVDDVDLGLCATRRRRGWRRACACGRFLRRRSR